MRRALPLLPVVFILFGCGGSDSGGTKPRDLSAFVGTWEGTYQERGGARHSGTVRISIAQNGPHPDVVGVTSTVTDDTRGEGTAIGQIPRTGDAEITFGFGSLPTMYPYIGTARIDARGHLVAPLLYGTANGDAANDFDLAPVAP